MSEGMDTFHVIWGGLINAATVFSVLLALLLIVEILRSPRIPAATLGWLFIIIFEPIIGIPLYLTFGKRKLKAQLRRKKKIDLPSVPRTHRHPLNSLLISLGIPSSSKDNLVKFHEDGAVAYQELLALLEGAQRTIDIVVFILDDDLIGRKILSELESKAAQGVKVRLLLDGVGSLGLAKNALEPLLNHGGEVAWFIPVMHRPLRGRTNLRNHRKIIIVDHEIVWTGGRNFTSEYLGADSDCPNNCWIDLSFSLQGSAINTYRAVFEADWLFATDSLSPKAVEMAPSTSKGKSCVQVIPSGPDVVDDPIYAVILTACYKARQQITIVTPYYVPDVGIQEALKLAALRGIKVDLIMPAKSDHYFADIARNRYLRELDSAGVQIWFLADAMVHAKVLVFDSSFAMSGSANLDIRSLFLNFEVMSGFYSKDEIEWLAQWSFALRDRSNRYSAKSVGLFKEMFEGLILLGAYQF